jgi:hypothetical protein
MTPVSTRNSRRLSWRTRNCALPDRRRTVVRVGDCSATWIPEVPMAGVTSEPSCRISEREAATGAGDGATGRRAWSTTKPTATIAATPTAAKPTDGRSARSLPIHRRNLSPKVSGACNRSIARSMATRLRASSCLPGATAARKMRASSSSAAHTEHSSRWRSKAARSLALSSPLIARSSNSCG